MSFWDFITPLSVGIMILFWLTIVYAFKPVGIAFMGDDYEDIVLLQIALGKGDKLTLESRIRLGYHLGHPHCLKVCIDNADVYWDDEKRGELIALAGTTKPGHSIITAVSTVEAKVWSLGCNFSAHRDYGHRFWIKQAAATVTSLVGIIAIWLVIAGFYLLRIIIK